MARCGWGTETGFETRDQDQGPLVCFFFPTVFRFSFLGKGDNDRLAWRIHFRYANNRGERQKSNKCVSTESGAPPPLLRSTE
jgi:hypothetical protein